MVLIKRSTLNDRPVLVMVIIVMIHVIIFPILYLLQHFLQLFVGHPLAELLGHALQILE